VSEFSLFGKDIFGQPRELPGGALHKRFIWPPFSVLDTKSGLWQARKKAWLRLGIQSELGREGDLIHRGENYRPNWEPYQGGHPAWGGKGSSVFDPVLCELAYTWFCPKGGKILDPFAGGSVRGVVASLLGYRYVGIELRKEQVRANEAQKHIAGRVKPRWIVGDSTNVKELAPGEYDFLFSCPPYYDLEVYSSEPGELSAMKTYEEFLAGYRRIIGNCVELLKNNRFACFVVSDVRNNNKGKEGRYRGLVADTVKIFQCCGMDLYNEAVLIHPSGSLSIRVGKQFESSRKLGRMHQSVLIFVKGSPRKATEAVAGETKEGKKEEDNENENQ